MDALEHVRGNAWSFSTVEPPRTAELIGFEQRIINGKTEIFYYYEDKDPEAENKYLFQTESGFQEAREMEEATKRINDKRRAEKKLMQSANCTSKVS